MSTSLWDTPITMSISDNMVMFQAVQLPFKNVLKIASRTGLMYCASVFNGGGKRDWQHWTPGAQILVLDFDKGLNEYTKAWLQEQLGFLLPTRNHLKDKGGVNCERYRAILLLDKPLNVSAKEFVNIHRNIVQDNHLQADESCTDVSRFYYGFGDAESPKHIKVLSGEPFDWGKYNYEDTIEMIGLPSPKRAIDLTPYEHIDMTYVRDLPHSRRHECPICAIDGLDPRKHHMGFSLDKDLLTCFYDKEGHSPILRGLYQKQMYGDIEEQEEDTSEVPEAEKKYRKMKCKDCNGQGTLEVKNATSGEREEVQCPKCSGVGYIMKEVKPKKASGPKVKKPSLPDHLVPTRTVEPKGTAHYNQYGVVTDIVAEFKKYVNEPNLSLDVETYYPYTVAVTEEELKTLFKDKYISIGQTYKRVVKDLEKGSLDEIDNRVRLITIGSPTNVTAFDISIMSAQELSVLFSLIKSKTILGHNLKFDFKSLCSTYGTQILPKRCFDTMLGSKILWMAHSAFEPNANNTLEAVVKRYAGVSLAKGIEHKWGQDELSVEQISYALNDVKFLPKVYSEMMKAFLKEKSIMQSEPIDFDQLEVLGDFAKIHPVMALEMRFLLNLVRTELRGVKINVSVVRNVVKEMQDTVTEVTQRLGFNPASNPDSLAYVKKVLGPHMTGASKEDLAPHLHIQEIALLQKGKQSKMRAGLLAKLYESKSDGRVHTKFTQILSTARMASKEPNMQQVPRTVKEKIYEAPPGKFLASADYPAIEMRIGAVHHKEPVMLTSFKHGEDLHYKMANLMTKKLIPNEDQKGLEGFITKEERNSAKCYAAGTEVLTNQGWIRIEDICSWTNKEDLVAYEGSLKAIDPTGVENDILATYRGTTTEMIDMELEDGSILLVTPDHKMYVLREGLEQSVLAKDLRLSDDILEFKPNRNSKLLINES